MKKFLTIFVLLIFVGTITTACSYKHKPKANMIQSKRRFAEYVEPGQNNGYNSIDLSEGPKLKYDKHVGPKNLDFDIKIVDPYKY